MANTAMRIGLVFMLAAACGPKKPDVHPSSGPAQPKADEPAVAPVESAAPTPAPAPAPPTETPGPASEAPAPAGNGLRAQCEKVCQQVAAKCSKTVAENCALNCEKYDKTPKACEPYAGAALQCAVGAKDLPCAAMAPESCAKEYRAASDCQKAPDTFQAKKEEKKQKLPEGWGVYDEASFSVPAPGGVTKSTVGTESVWTAAVGGARYSVRKLPPLTEKLTPKSQVRLASEWLKPCTLKMKLHGQVEKGDSSSLHYDSGCKDGSERHGMIHVTPSALYIVGVEAPAGEKVDVETFVYGFALK